MLIVFDLDDTLLDHKGAMRRAIIDFYRSHNILHKMSEEDFIDNWFKESYWCFRQYLEGKYSFREQRIQRVTRIFKTVGEKLDEDSACNYFGLYLDHYRKHWRIFPDVNYCIKRLQGRYTLGVLSNGQGEQQKNKLRKIGLLDKFKYMFFAGDLGMSKPSPEIFHHLLEEVELSPEEVIYVGDNLKNDVLSSCKIGINGILVDREERYRGHYSQDDIEYEFVNSLEELPSLIKRMTK